MRDQLAAVSLLEYETSVGPCGQLHTESTGDMEGWYSVNDDLVCHACAALEQYQKDNAEKGAEPGTLLRVIDTKKYPQD